MFAHTISMRLKPNSIAKFIQTLQDEIDPVLRKQQGFRGHIAFLVRDGTEAVTISLWNKKESAMGHNDGSFKTLLTLANLVKGTPQVRMCEISSSTSNNHEQLHSLVRMVEGIPHIQIYEVSRPILRAIAAQGLVSYQKQV